MSFSSDSDAGYGRVMKELVEVQFTLFSYICALTAHSQDARDILQETNLRICKQAEKYDPSRPFIKWAKTLAFYEVMTYRKKRQRNWLVFEDDVLDTVAEQIEDGGKALEIERNFKLLEGCIGKLPATLREVVEARYREGGSLRTVAQLFGRSTNAVKLLLVRARRALFDCVHLASGEGEEA
jgi:RNA polymerase sigma-70 factor (ECF subfamily)